jgi:hypothetical protein
MLIDLSVYVVGVDDTCDLSHATTTSTHSTQCRVPLPCHPLPPRHCHTIPSGCQRPLCEGRTPTHRASTPTLRSNMRRSNSPFVFVLVWLLLPALPCVEGICVVPTPWLLHVCSQHITTPAVRGFMSWEGVCLPGLSKFLRLAPWPGAGVCSHWHSHAAPHAPPAAPGQGCMVPRRPCSMLVASLTWCVRGWR